MNDLPLLSDLPSGGADGSVLLLDIPIIDSALRLQDPISGVSSVVTA